MKFWIYAVYFHLYLQETKANEGLKNDFIELYNLTRTATNCSSGC
jgi:hypothetical protein